MKCHYPVTQRNLHVLCSLVMAMAAAMAMPGPAEDGQKTAATELADFFIAPNGNDTWTGRLAQPNEAGTDGPFATLCRARDAVRSLKQRNEKKDIVILIRGGRIISTKRLSSRWRIPLPRATIMYAAYGSEAPVFTSALPIGNWKKLETRSPLLPEIAQDKVWTADVPDALSNVLTLYHGCRRMRRAWSRPFAPRASVDKKVLPPDRMAFPPGAMKNWPDLTNGELRVIPTADYEMCLLPLAGVDEKAGLARTTVPASRAMGRVKFMNESVCVENILEVLDEPGEWVFNSAERKLYLWPTGDEPSGGVGILLAGYGPGTKDVNKRNEVSNNWVHDVGQIYWASPAIMVWQSGENRVTNNLIHNTPYSGIVVSGRTGWTSATEDTFRAHEVELPAYDSLPSASSGSSSVHREWWAAREEYMHGRRNFVAYNDIHGVMEVMGDGNAIYISGTGKENHIYRNYIHHVDGDGTASGIRCDNDQYETIIEANILYKIRSAQSGISTTEMNHIIDNIIVDVIPSRRPITKPNIVHVYIAIPNPTWPLEGARIKHNIIWSPRADYWPIVEHRSFSTGAGDRLKDTDTDYNLYWCPKDPQWGQRHIDEQKGYGVEMHSISADPMFMDLEKGDLRLKPESPAWKLGFQAIDMSQIGLRPNHSYWHRPQAGGQTAEGEHIDGK